MNPNRKDIRPVIKGINTILNKSAEEQFQNQVLRPIIKMQHNLLILHFKEYLIANKCQFVKISRLEQEAFIATAFKKDVSFKSELKGLIMGHFTTDEFEVYTSSKGDLNKRILAMIQQRITSVIELF